MRNGPGGACSLIPAQASSVILYLVGHGLRHASGPLPQNSKGVLQKIVRIRMVFDGFGL